MRLGTLFSGIGAPEQGAKRVYGDDLELVFACEWDKFARKSFKANYDISDEHFHVDINDMDGTQYKGKVDVIVGGSPCQDFSIAGLRAGVDGQRGQLIWQYFRIIKEVMPQIFIYENVKGFVRDKNGKTLKDFLEVFRSIGYNCHYEVVNTKYYGVPQNRERIYIVGFLDIEMYYRFEFAPKVSLIKRLKDVLEQNVDEKYYINRDIELFKEENEGVIGMLDIKGNDCIRRVYGVDGNAPCLQTMQGGMREPKILDFTNDFNEGKTREYADFSPTLRSERFGLAVQEPNIIQLNEPKFSQQRIYSTEGISPTIAAGNLGGGKEPCKHLTDDYRIRKLTPRECLRLQDFPDTFKQVVSDSQMYKQTGNSMSVNILEMIFKQIDNVIIGKCCVGKGSLF